MKILKIIVLLLLVAFIAIQFFPIELNKSDIIPKTDFLLVNTVPETIQKKLQVSCYDCHSNNTHYPWYSKIQPMAWFMEKHIKEGKDELNFNEWDDYSNRRKNSKLKSIINQIKDDEMPLESYTYIHSDATFSEKEKKEMVQFMQQLKDSL